MKIAGIILVAAGLAYAVKTIMKNKEQRSCWHKIKVEEAKEEKEEKRTGSRYGSNPVKY